MTLANRPNCAEHLAQKGSEMSKKMNAGEAAATMAHIIELLNGAQKSVLEAVRNYVCDRIDILSIKKAGKAKAVQP